MADQDPLDRQAEGEDVARAVEPVVEAVEQAPVPGQVEAPHEARRRLPHARERPLDPGTEEIHAAVGHARGEQPDDLAVGRVRVAERIPDGVDIGPRDPVGLAVQPLERRQQPGCTASRVSRTASGRGPTVRGELPGK